MSDGSTSKGILFSLISYSKKLSRFKPNIITGVIQDMLSEVFGEMEKSKMRDF